jgi:hypothetical protein
VSAIGDTWAAVIQKCGKEAYDTLFDVEFERGKRMAKAMLEKLKIRTRDAMAWMDVEEALIGMGPLLNVQTQLGKVERSVDGTRGIIEITQCPMYEIWKTHLTPEQIDPLCSMVGAYNLGLAKEINQDLETESSCLMPRPRPVGSCIPTGGKSCQIIIKGPAKVVSEVRAGKYCHSCGYQMPRNYKHCPECGTKQEV